MDSDTESIAYHEGASSPDPHASAPMEGIDEDDQPQTLPSEPTPTVGEGTTSRAAPRIPPLRPGRGGFTYANVLKRSADQIGNDPLERPQEECPPQEEEITGEGADSFRDRKRAPGPIKGFSTEKVLENLDLTVREEWSEQAEEAVFVHYLNGGYNPNVAQNVHIIAEDLTSKPPTKS